YPEAQHPTEVVGVGVVEHGGVDRGDEDMGRGRRIGAAPALACPAHPTHLCTPTAAPRDGRTLRRRPSGCGGGTPRAAARPPRPAAPRDGAAAPPARRRDRW